MFDIYIHVSGFFLQGSLFFVENVTLMPEGSLFCERVCVSCRQSVSSLLIDVEWTPVFTHVCVCVGELCLYRLPAVSGIWSAASWAQRNQTHCCLLYDELFLPLSSTDKHASVLIWLTHSICCSSVFPPFPPVQCLLHPCVCV